MTGTEVLHQNYSKTLTKYCNRVQWTAAYFYVFSTFRDPQSRKNRSPVSVCLSVRIFIRYITSVTTGWIVVKFYTCIYISKRCFNFICRCVPLKCKFLCGFWCFAVISPRSEWNFCVPRASSITPNKYQLAFRQYINIINVQ